MSSIKPKNIIGVRMRNIRKSDTKPELIVRQLIHGMGYRYRLHCKELPGTPDLVFPRYKKVIFVNGCFWHQHSCRLGRKKPTTNQEYWLPKLARNVKRDQEIQKELLYMGWTVLVLWECEIYADDSLVSKVEAFLTPSTNAIH